MTYQNIVKLYSIIIIVTTLFKRLKSNTIFINTHNFKKNALPLAIWPPKIKTNEKRYIYYKPQQRHLTAIFLLKKLYVLYRFFSKTSMFRKLNEIYIQLTYFMVNDKNQNN